MSERFVLTVPIPPAAAAAIEVARALRAAGHEALLAGGCVRDLLLGRSPSDYDVATDARPERVCELFRATRQVGAAFGVVLVLSRRRWVEVATFRTDGEYLDGRRPSEVAFTDARHDAQRRDFTINGMFLDPQAGEGIDYVGGRADLAARLVRCIGQPEKRLDEDHLRLLRAVRFAARLGFAIEPATFAAIRERAALLSKVAPERVREELEKMWSHAGRAETLRLIRDAGLAAYLWPGAQWRDAALTVSERLPDAARFELVLMLLLADRDSREIERVCRALACSNQQRDVVAWLARSQSALDDPAAIRLSALKRLMAGPAFDQLEMLARARFADLPDADTRAAELSRRLAAIAPEAVAPPPLITGDDLIARGVPAGPQYRRVLDELYTRQLDEVLSTRAQALHELDQLLGADRPPPR